MMIWDSFDRNVTSSIALLLLGIFLLIMTASYARRTAQKAFPTRDDQQQEPQQQEPQQQEPQQQKPQLLKKQKMVDLQQLMNLMHSQSIDVWQLKDIPTDTWLQGDRTALLQFFETEFEGSPDFFRITRWETSSVSCVGLGYNQYFYLVDKDKHDVLGDMITVTPYNTVTIWGYPVPETTHGFIQYALQRTFASLGYKAYHIADYGKKIPITQFTIHPGLQVISRNLDNCYYNSLTWSPNSLYIFLNIYPPGLSADIMTQFASPLHEIFPDIRPEQYVCWLPYRKSIYQIIGPEHFKDLHPYHEYYSAKYNLFLFHYCTDLLPKEIQQIMTTLTPSSVQGQDTDPIVYYVATTHPNLHPFEEACQRHGLKWELVYGKTTFENVALQQASRLCPVIQVSWQLEDDYLPCRLFKNISFGRMVITNNPAVLHVFPNVVYDKNPSRCISKGLQRQTTWTVKEQRKQMELVAQYFTYVHKVKRMTQQLYKQQ